MTAKPTKPIPRTLRRIVIIFLVISIVFVGVAVFAVRTINQSAAASDWVNHTHAAILEAQGVLTELYAGDVALRTFLLGGDARDQVEARQAYSRMQEHLDLLQALLGAEAQPNPAVGELVRLVAARASSAAELGARRANPAEPAAALLAADVSSGLTADIRRQIERLREQQMELLAARDTVSYLQAQRTRWIVWAGVVFDVLLLAGVGWLLRDDIEARRRMMEVLEQANVELDAKVQARTGELAASNAHLATENLERRWTNQALEHQLHYAELIFNSLNDLVLVLTKALNISRINPAVVEGSGFSAVDLINRPLDSLVELLPAESAAPGPQADRIAHALNAGREVSGPGRLHRKAGGDVPVHVTVCPLRDGNQVVGGVVVLKLEGPKRRPS